MFLIFIVGWEIECIIRRIVMKLPSPLTILYSLSLLWTSNSPCPPMMLLSNSLYTPTKNRKKRKRERKTLMSSHAMQLSDCTSPLCLRPQLRLGKITSDPLPTFSKVQPQPSSVLEVKLTALGPMK